MLLTLARGPTLLAIYLTGKKDPKPPSASGRGWWRGIRAIRTIGARQRANGLSSVGYVFGAFMILCLIQIVPFFRFLLATFSKGRLV